MSSGLDGTAGLLTQAADEAGSMVASWSDGLADRDKIGRGDDGACVPRGDGRGDAGGPIVPERPRIKKSA